MKVCSKLGWDFIELKLKRVVVSIEQECHVLSLEVFFKNGKYAY